jgi:hypothetical protein
MCESDLQMLSHRHEKLIMKSSSGKPCHENCVLFMRENPVLFMNRASTLMSQSYTYMGARKRAHHASTLMRHESYIYILMGQSVMVHESYVYLGVNLSWFMKDPHTQEPILTLRNQVCIFRKQGPHQNAIQNAPKSHKKPQKPCSKYTFSSHHEPTLLITPGSSLALRDALT